MSSYLVVTSPENWRRTAALGWKLLGLKSTRRNIASGLQPGDRIACYETGSKRFVAVVEVDGPCFVDQTPIWSAKKAGEVYPYRYPIRPLAAAADHAVDAIALAAELEFPKKWGPHLSLAFQGNIKAIPAADIARIQTALDAVAGAAIP